MPHLPDWSRRKDSEHEQATVRLAIAVLFVMYLVGLGHGRGYGQPEIYWAIAIVGGEFVAGFGILMWIWLRPDISHPRRILGMVADYATLASIMWLEGEALSPLYVIFLWITIGNGLRFGPGYLFGAMGLAVVGFTIVMLTNPYWRTIPYLAWGLLGALIIIPGYLTKLLRDLRAANVKARRASEAKTRFLANMSHEFRTPLNGIVGMAELLTSTRLTREQRECADVIQSSAQTLLLLVEDVLDISAIEAGKLRRQYLDFNLREPLRRLQTMLQPQAAEKKLSFVIDLPPDVPLMLHGDPGHLGQILMNLLHNAIKFTVIGEVRLEIRVRSSTEQSVALRFSVRDTGPGIPAEMRERIFEAFEQVDSGPTRKHGGTGLGTTIAKTLTELLGGRIGIEENRPGEGGGTHFWVDLEFGLSESLAEPVELAPSDAAAAPAAGKVIAFDDPFVRHRARVRALRILVADDQHSNRIVLQRLLERAGHEVVLAEDGEQALDRIEQGSLDVAILDLHMPVFSGLDVIKQARVMHAGRQRMPIIALSADATVDAIRGAEEAGAYAFLTKPIVVVRLLDTLAEVAGGAPSTAAGSAAAAAEQRIIARNDEPLPSLQTDMLEELARIGVDSESLRSFVNECLRDIGRSMGQMEHAAEAGRWEEVREAAHAIKGVAGNLGIAVVADRSGEIMRSSDSALQKDWRRYFGELSACLDAAAQQVRRELAHLSSSSGESGSPDHESI